MDKLTRRIYDTILPKDKTLQDKLSKSAILSQTGVALSPVIAATIPVIGGVAATRGMANQREKQLGENDLRDSLAMIGTGELGAYVKTDDWYKDAFRGGNNTLRNTLRTTSEEFSENLKKNVPYKQPVKRPTLKGMQTVRVDDIIPGPRGRLVNNYQPKRIFRLGADHFGGYADNKDVSMMTRGAGKVMRAVDGQVGKLEDGIGKIGSRVRPSGSPLRNVGAGVARAAKDLSNVRFTPSERTMERIGRLKGGKIRAFAKGAARGSAATLSGGLNLGKGLSSLATGAGRGVTQLGRNLGTGAIHSGAATMGANAVLAGLAESGAYSALDIDKDDAKRLTAEFMDSGYSIGGNSVPNADPLAAVVKTKGAIENLHDVNVERGHHADTITGRSKFVYDQISDYGDDVDVELGDNILANAGEAYINTGAAVTGRVVGATGAAAVGAVTGVAKVGGAAGKKLKSFKRKLW